MALHPLVLAVQDNVSPAREITVFQAESGEHYSDERDAFLHNQIMELIEAAFPSVLSSHLHQVNIALGQIIRGDVE